MKVSNSFSAISTAADAAHDKRGTPPIIAERHRGTCQRATTDDKRPTTIGTVGDVVRRKHKSTQNGSNNEPKPSSSSSQSIKIHGDADVIGCVEAIEGTAECREPPSGDADACEAACCGQRARPSADDDQVASPKGSNPEILKSHSDLTDIPEIPCEFTRT